MKSMKRKERVRTDVSVSSMLSVMELIIVIGFFAVTSTFLLRFFTSANRLSEEAEVLGKAVIAAESVTELVKAKGFDAAMKELSFLEENGKKVLKYDRNFRRAKGASSYALFLERELLKEGRGTLYKVRVLVMRERDGETVFELSSENYEKRGGI